MKPVELALREWGARKLEHEVTRWRTPGQSLYINRDTVTVDFETYSDGYCETCYFEEERCYVSGSTPDGKTYREYFTLDFSDVMNELLEIEI